MTSGMTSGAVVMPDEQRAAAERPEAREHEARERAQHHRAGRRERGDLDRQPGGIEDLLVGSSATYQRRVGESAASHTVTSRELLNENTTIDRIGT